MRFAVAGYDHTQPLTIDPILDYSTFLGGTGAFGDLATGLALDADEGNAYLVGATTSTNCPQVNAESTPPGDIAAETAFVAELSPDGTALLYSTYLGGSGNGTFGENLGKASRWIRPARPTFTLRATPFAGLSCQHECIYRAARDGGNHQRWIGLRNETESIAHWRGSADLFHLFGRRHALDDGHGIAVDPTGNIYVVGDPIHGFSARERAPLSSQRRRNCFSVGVQTQRTDRASFTGFLHLPGRQRRGKCGTLRG